MGLFFVQIHLYTYSNLGPPLGNTNLYTVMTEDLDIIYLTHASHTLTGLLYLYIYAAWLPVMVNLGATFIYCYGTAVVTAVHHIIYTTWNTYVKEIFCHVYQSIQRISARTTSAINTK